METTLCQSKCDKTKPGDTVAAERGWDRAPLRGAAAGQPPMSCHSPVTPQTLGDAGTAPLGPLA